MRALRLVSWLHTATGREMKESTEFTMTCNAIIMAGSQKENDSKSIGCKFVSRKRISMMVELSNVD